MIDMLVELNENVFAQKTMKKMGLKLPMPLPVRLRRMYGGFELDPYKLPFTGKEQMIHGIHVGGEKGSLVCKILSQRWGYHQSAQPDRIIFDATHCDALADMDKLYQFFHEQLDVAPPHSRMLIISKGLDKKKTAAQEVNALSIEGFYRSLAKEIGPKGSTCNHVVIPPHLLTDEESLTRRLLPVAGFLLSDFSAFISGQTVTISDDVPYEGSMRMSLEGKRILVTGGAHGIGAAIVKNLSRLEADVVLVDMEKEKEAALRVAFDRRVTFVPYDLSEGVDQLCDIWDQPFDAVIHNAGITRDKTLLKLSGKAWQDVMHVNLRAPVALTEQLLARKLIHQQARVIFMSSVSGIAGNFGQSHYAAAKSGLIGLARFYANKYGKKGMSFNCIAPGFIATRMTRHLPLMASYVGKRLNNLGQGGLPMDVAHLASFLAMPCSHGVNGQVIRVCGGHLMGQ